MALPVLLEVGANVLPFLFELAIQVVFGMAAPLKFLFSRPFRQAAMRGWRQRPWLAFLQIPGALFLLIAGTWILWVWGSTFAGFMADNKRAADARRQQAGAVSGQTQESVWQALKEKGVEKVRQMEKGHQEKAAREREANTKELQKP